MALVGIQTNDGDHLRGFDGLPGGCEGGIRWDDPALGITYPEITPIVSDKDQKAPTPAEWLADSRSQYFQFAGGGE